MTLNQKNQEVLDAHIKIIEKEPRKHNFGILKELAQETQAPSKTNDEPEKPAKLEVSDKDQSLFFGDEFSDSGPSVTKGEDNKLSEESAMTVDEKADIEKLIDYEKDFDEFMASASILLPSQLLMDDALFNDTSVDSSMDLLGSLVPSQAADVNQSSSNLLAASKENSIQMNKNPSKKTNDVSKWFSLFSELDPLNQQVEQDDASKNFHAA